MKILAVDDENLALLTLCEAIEANKAPEDELVKFEDPFDALSYAKSNIIDTAFLDVTMHGLTGVELAKKLKEINPVINIIFSTGWDEYRIQAFDMHASGYITKPITPAKVKKEMDDLRYRQPVSGKKPQEPLLKVKCFGNFEACDSSGIPVHFERLRAKELFAYLIFRNGAAVTSKEIANILFEDGYYDKKEQMYVQKIISAMMKGLKDVGADSVINKNYNNYAVIKECIECDYFTALETKKKGNYMGEFMAQYSWAEEFNYFFENLKS